MELPQMDETALHAAWADVRQHVPQPQAIVVLRLGDDRSMLAWGTGVKPEQVSPLPLGLLGLAHRLLPAERLSALAIESTMAEVEDIVMPWHGQLPASAQLFTDDAAMAELARWAGMPDADRSWSLTTEAVEHLFNRWVALAQGRPASQDELPTTGRFSATLLVLREWLHHLGFVGITIRRRP